jgi:hypothetical protein
MTRPGHDTACEFGKTELLDYGGLPGVPAAREDCECAVRAYERDPLPGAEREPKGEDPTPW